MTSISRRTVVAGLLAIGAVSLPAYSQGVGLTIQVNLPTDRTRSGSLVLKSSDGTALTGDLPALGKSDNAKAAASNNPSRDPTQQFGDTPEGNYSVPRIVATGANTAYASRSYGPIAAIVLKPEGGEALLAAQNGRKGLLIHGGDAGANGRLRATHGCIRLSNADMQVLLDAIAAAGNNAQLQRCDIVRLSVLVGGEADEGAGDDESDPPFDIENLLQPGPVLPPPG